MTFRQALRSDPRPSRLIAIASTASRTLTRLISVDAWQAKVREAVEVIANAGWGASGKTAKLSLADWNATLAVNLTGTFLTFRQALRSDPRPSRLIAIASTASLKGNASVPAYTAAKHGVLGLVRSIALDVAKTNTTCNAICPGFTETDLAETAITGLMSRFNIDRSEATAKVAAGNPRGNLISPDEIAQTALFLASKGASAINGHALSVSGGEI